MSNLRSQTPIAIRCVSGTILSVFLLANPAAVLAHGGHGDEFHQENQAKSNGSIQVDAQTAQRIGIKIEPVKRQRLAVGIKTTGQIETLPSQKVEVTTPISGAKVVELLVEPGATVKQNQPVAVLTSPDLVTLRVESQEKLAQGQADLRFSQADLKLAEQNYERYQQIAAAEIAQTQSRVAFAQEKYNKDKQLADAGALPRRNALESQTELASAKADLTKASSRRDVIEAENQLQRAIAAVEVAKTKINLSNKTYTTRLQQLGNRANEKGLVTVTAPISGKVADREVTIGQSFEDAGGKLMTIVNDSRVYATANIYEKDLSKVKTGQTVNVKVASLPDRTFTGKIAVVGSVVEGETRIVPVKAEIANSGGILKPGMFAELEVLTDKTSAAILSIPNSAVVEANNKKQVYVQNGNAYQPVEVTLGQISGDMVEVKTGLFEGDSIVTQRATQLYAQSLRGGSKKGGEQESKKVADKEVIRNFPVSWLVATSGGAALATVAFIAGIFWSGRRTKHQLISLSETQVLEEANSSAMLETAWDDNHHVSHEQESKVTNKNYK